MNLYNMPVKEKYKAYKEETYWVTRYLSILQAIIISANMSDRKLRGFNDVNAIVGLKG